MVSAHSFGKTASIHIELRENEQILKRKISCEPLEKQVCSFKSLRGFAYMKVVFSVDGEVMA